MSTESNGKGLQVFLAILSVAGLGVAAYTPLYNQIANVEARLAAHVRERGHPWLLEKNAGARVRFQEVETQFREAKTIADLRFHELKEASVKKRARTRGRSSGCSAVSARSKSRSPG